MRGRERSFLRLLKQLTVCKGYQGAFSHPGTALLSPAGVRDCLVTPFKCRDWRYDLAASGLRHARRCSATSMLSIHDYITAKRVLCLSTRLVSGLQSTETGRVSMFAIWRS
jgi:hypothetical protein